MVYVEISWVVFSPVAPPPQPFPVAFLSCCSTGSSGDIKKSSAWDVFEACRYTETWAWLFLEAVTRSGAGRELVLRGLAPQKQLPSAVLGREDEILVSFTIVLLGVKTLKQLSHTQSCISMSQLKSMKYRAVVLLQWFVEKKITWFLNHFYNSFLTFKEVI